MTRHIFHKSFGSISDIIAAKRRDHKHRQQCLRHRQATARREADDWESFWEEAVAPRVPTLHSTMKGS